MTDLLIDWLIMTATNTFSDRLIFLHIEHRMTHISTTMNTWYSPYILTHNWRLFLTFCAQYVTLVVNTYCRIYWALKDYIHTSWLRCIPFVLIFYCCLWNIKWLTCQQGRTLGPHCILAIYSNTYLAPNHCRHFFILLIFYCKPQVYVSSCKWWILWLTYWLIDWSCCDRYIWWPSYIPTYWTSNDSHISHDQRLGLPYILLYSVEWDVKL